jgi:hypothetical protein
MGTHITEAEYVNQLQALLERCAAEGTPTEKAAELEFGLTVRFRLGDDFPLERTAALWKIRRSFNEERDRIGHGVAGPLSVIIYNFRLFFLIRRLRKAFLTVLSADQVRALLDG